MRDCFPSRRKKGEIMAQALQQEVMGNFFRRLINPWEIYSDNEIMKLYTIAVETRDGKNIKALKDEMNRRIRE